MPTDLARCFCDTNCRWKIDPADTPSGHLPDARPGSIEPPPGGVSASDLFSDHVLQNMLVQSQVGHNPLEPRVFLFKLAQPTNLASRKIAVLLPPVVKRRL